MPLLGRVLHCLEIVSGLPIFVELPVGSSKIGVVVAAPVVALPIGVNSATVVALPIGVTSSPVGVSLTIGVTSASPGVLPIGVASASPGVHLPIGVASPSVVILAIASASVVVLAPSVATIIGSLVLGLSALFGDTLLLLTMLVLVVAATVSAVVAPSCAPRSPVHSPSAILVVASVMNLLFITRVLLLLLKLLKVHFLRFVGVSVLFVVVVLLVVVNLLLVVGLGLNELIFILVEHCFNDVLEVLGGHRFNLQLSLLMLDHVGHHWHVNVGHWHHLRHLRHLRHVRHVRHLRHLHHTRVLREHAHHSNVGALRTTDFLQNFKYLGIGHFNEAWEGNGHISGLLQHLEQVSLHVIAVLHGKARVEHHHVENDLHGYILERVLHASDFNQIAD